MPASPAGGGTGGGTGRAPVRGILTSLLLVLAAGCVSDEQYARVYDSYRRQLRANQENLKTIQALKTLNRKLQQEKKALQAEIDKRDLWLEAWSRRLEWTKHLPDAVVSESGDLVLAGDVLFLPGSHDLSPAGKARLLQVARVLAQEKHRIKEVRIEGHSDKFPIRKTRDKYDSNMELSFMRAYAVYRLLLEKSGLEENKFSIAAYGEHRPRSENPAENRRVEIRVLIAE